MIVQIYAFTHLEDVQTALTLGVDHLGFVAGKYDLVPGELSFAEARQIVETVAGRAVCVALTMSEDVEEILRMAAAVQPDIIHISTDVEAMGVDAMRELRRRLPAGMRLMKAVPVDDERSVALAQQYAAVSDLLLLDTKVHGMPGVGATGRTHDWNISRKIVESVAIPVILAGGLTAENVAAAMGQVQPSGVDSNTATNVPGDAVEKDMRRVADFVRAARSAEEAA